MSNRERWTIYPLLFLTLGIVLKDKLTKFVNTDVVVCKTLVVTDRDHRERVVVSSNAAGGIVKAESSNHRVNVLLGHTDSLFGLIFTDGNGKLLPQSFQIRQPARQIPGSSKTTDEPANPGPADLDAQQPAENPESSPPAQDDPAP